VNAMAKFPGARAACWGLAFGLALSGHDAAAAPPPPKRIDLIVDLPAAGDLAAPANGQTLYVLDESVGAVVAIDPFEPAKRWTALSAPPHAEPGHGAAAIGCIDTGMLAVVSRNGDVWSLQTHRLQPGTAADPDRTAQSLALGKSAPQRREVGAGGPGSRREPPPVLAVSPSRDWLSVCGLPSPIPPVMRGPIAGARVGTISARGCPDLAAGVQPTAATISMGEELVLFAADVAAAPTAGIFVSYWRPPDPRTLLHLDTGLPRIRDAAFCRADGTLWVVGGGDVGAGADAVGGPAAAPLPEGLWRIDAVLRDGRQAAAAVCIAPLPGAVSVVCLSEKAIIVTHGREGRTVSRIDPSQQGNQP